MGKHMKQKEKKQKAHSSVGVLLGAAFIMATSAIGPGFLTQTAHYTDLLKGSFGFVILATVLISLAVQLNVWRVICVSGKQAQVIANELIPRFGHVLSLLIGAGGIVFAIGNIGGGALGLHSLFGISQSVGTLLAGGIALTVFLMKNVVKAMDRLSKILGLSTILIILFIIFMVKPPVGLALKETVFPSALMDGLADGIRTLLGGTVGGYITFAGAHRLLDAGVTGKERLSEITESSVTGILIASLVRVLLFLAVLGVTAGVTGSVLEASNPAADAFVRGAGKIGGILFSMILISASVTTTVGCSYTTMSFVKTIHPWVEEHSRFLTCMFIAVCTGLMEWIGKPAKLLIIAGSLNAFLIPITLGMCLAASRKSSIMGGDYHHPRWMSVCGILAILLTLVLIAVTF